MIPGSGRSAGEGIGYPLQYSSLVAQLVRNLPAIQETWVQSLGWEDPLEKGKANPLQYSGLENSMDCIDHGVARSQTRLCVSVEVIGSGTHPVNTKISGCSSPLYKIA